MFSIIVEPHATRAARQPQQQQQQQQQQGSGQTSSQEPEGADRAVPSVDYHAEMQGDLGAGQNPEAAQAGQPPSRSAQRVRVYPVRWDRIRTALDWLKENNPFYEDIHIQIPEGPDLEPDAGEFANAPFQPIPQFVQTDNQPQLAESALAEALNHLTPDEVSQHYQLGAEAAQQRGRRPRYHLERNGAQPLSIRDNKNIEAMSFLRLYPKGRNHFGAAAVTPAPSNVRVFLGQTPHQLEMLASCIH